MEPYSERILGGPCSPSIPIFQYSSIPMKILMLNYEFPPIGGGAAQAHLCLLQQYANVQYLYVDVLTSAPKPDDVTEKLAENITIYKVGLHKKHLHFWRKIEVIEWLIKAGFRYHALLRKN